MNVWIKNCRDGPITYENARFYSIAIATRVGSLASECRRILGERGIPMSQVALIAERKGDTSVFIAAQVPTGPLLSVVHQALAALALEADLTADSSVGIE
jgi:hypothetical protein